MSKKSFWGERGAKALDHALKAGANNYIIKPFEPATIVSKIQEVLNK